MNYVKVESSQIEAVAYDPENQILGIKFPPNKRQPNGAEYHYSDVPPRIHRALVEAPSIGSYFGQNIKSRPDLYPYMKVEAATPMPAYASQEPGMFDDPKAEGWVPDPQRPNGKSTTRTVGMKIETSNHSTTSDGGTIDAPNTALAIIDTTEDELLFTPGKITDAQLAAGREWYLTEAKKYDISTEKSRAELKRFARPLQKLRTGIEARAKELTGATKRKIAAIDAEKRRLVMLVGGIEDEVLAPLTAWENEEEERKTRLAGIVKSLGEHVMTAVYPSIASLEETIAELETFDLSTMQEYKLGAESAIAASLRVLKPELERRKVAEANEAELARLRAEAAARAEQDRINAKAAEIAGKIVAEKSAPMPGPTIEQVLASNEKHRSQVNYEAAAALVSECLIDEPAAHEVISAIAKGIIPHVLITY